MKTFEFYVPEEKRVRVIIDSDAACEADDPFAIAHALMSPKLAVKAVIAEHFARKDSMERSFRAIKKLMDIMGADVPVFRGENWGEEENGISEGVQFIIDESRKEEHTPLYVLCLGALTNLAKAFSLAPDIVKKLTVISVGGRSYENSEGTLKEFNFGNDIKAANVVINSEAVFWQIPAGAYGRMRIGLAELQRRVSCCGDVGKYLFEQMNTFNQSKEACWTPGESWSLGDSAAVAVVLDPECGRYRNIRSGHVNEDTSYSFEGKGRMIREYINVESRYVIEDFISKLEICYGGNSRE